MCLYTSLYLIINYYESLDLFHSVFCPVSLASLAIHHFKRSSRAQQLLSTLAVIYSVESRNSESSFTPIKVKVDTWFSKYTCKYLHLTAKYLALTATGTWGSNIFSQFARMFCDFCHFFLSCLLLFPASV